MYSIWQDLNHLHRNCAIFEHTSLAHDWRSFKDLFGQLSTALGTVCGDKEADQGACG